MDGDVGVVRVWGLWSVGYGIWIPRCSGWAHIWLLLFEFSLCDGSALGYGIYNHEMLGWVWIQI